MYNHKWFVKYFVVQQNERALCLVCLNNIVCLRDLISSGTTTSDIRTKQGNFRSVAGGQSTSVEEVIVGTTENDTLLYK